MDKHGIPGEAQHHANSVDQRELGFDSLGLLKGGQDSLPHSRLAGSDDLTDAHFIEFTNPYPAAETSLPSSARAAGARVNITETGKVSLSDSHYGPNAKNLLPLLTMHSDSFPLAGNEELDRAVSENHDFALLEQQLEKRLRRDHSDFSGIFNDLDKHVAEHGRLSFDQLQALNQDLRQKGLLDEKLHIISTEKNSKQGWSIVSEDAGNPEQGGKRSATIVSTSAERAHESRALHEFYRHMHYGHGRYSGWKQSAAGGHAAHGGYDHHAVGGRVPEGARKELIDEALRLAGLPITVANEAAVNTIVTRESSWNPNITNNWDSNALAGHPSTGLMQTIPATFKKFALPGYDSNINDPLSNLIAGIRYAQHRYGSGGLSGVQVVASRPGGY